MFTAGRTEGWNFSHFFFFSNIFCFYFAVEVEEEGMSGVQLFFTLLFTVVGLVVLGVVGLIVYGRWKENKRKRFYWGKISQSAECVFNEQTCKDSMTQIEQTEL